MFYLQAQKKKVKFMPSMYDAIMGNCPYEGEIERVVIGKAMEGLVHISRSEIKTYIELYPFLHTSMNLSFEDAKQYLEKIEWNERGWNSKCPCKIYFFTENGVFFINKQADSLLVEDPSYHYYLDFIPRNPDWAEIMCNDEF